jgi:hypothetical protein
MVAPATVMHQPQSMQAIPLRSSSSSLPGFNPPMPTNIALQPVPVGLPSGFSAQPQQPPMQRPVPQQPITQPQMNHMMAAGGHVNLAMPGSGQAERRPVTPRGPAPIPLITPQQVYQPSIPQHSLQGAPQHAPQDKMFRQQPPPMQDWDAVGSSSSHGRDSAPQSAPQQKTVRPMPPAMHDWDTVGSSSSSRGKESAPQPTPHEKTARPQPAPMLEWDGVRSDYAPIVENQADGTNRYPSQVLPSSHSGAPAGTDQAGSQKPALDPLDAERQQRLKELYIEQQKRKLRCG